MAGESLQTALVAILTAPEGKSAEDQARAIANAIALWVSQRQVQVIVTPLDLGLQTSTSPGSPTLGPTAPVILTGGTIVVD